MSTNDRRPFLTKKEIICCVFLIIAAAFYGNLQTRGADSQTQRPEPAVSVQTSGQEVSVSEAETEEPYEIVKKAGAGKTPAEICLNLRYTGTAAVEVNNGMPFFDDDELTDESFEHYSELDRYGRAGTATACIGKDLMPTSKRDFSLSEITPSGWKNKKYKNVDGGWLYNRCHLIGWQLTAEGANEKNLITGTRYLNIDGMLYQENAVANYLKDYPGAHVMYRVTPVYKGAELVARGVLIEAFSIEDNGRGICFCFYCFNVQPGIEIDYKTGDSRLDNKD